MSSFRNLLKSDTPTASSDTGASRSAALGGQGSHFPRNNDPPQATRPADATGSTVTGAEPHTVGPSDTSAAPAPASQARATTGPEAGGSGHIGTASSAASAGLPGDRGTAQSSGILGSTTHSLPTTLRSGQHTSSGPSATAGTGLSANTGTAAIGETTTYSSRPLGSGDPTGSIVDHQSTDPLTYKLPEAGSHHSGTAATTGATPTSPSAVTSSAAATAASLAWSAQNKNERMPGEFPSAGNENPYKASNLDPRVDGGKLGSSTTQPSSSLPSHTRDPALAASSAAGAGNTAAYGSTGQASSTLTTTADPTARSSGYTTSSDTKGLGSASQPITQSQPTPTATAQSQPDVEQQGVLGKTLGALGLGGAASTAAGYLGYGAKGDSAEPRDTSAIATQPGVVAQESGPPKHYRRESIPTTAYPGGPNSPPAMAPPIGGTADARRSIDQGLSGSNTGSGISSERGIGGTAATAAGVTSGTGYGLGTGASGQTRQPEARDTAQPSSTSGDRTDTETGASGTATADAIDGGAFPLKSTNREAELLGSVDRDPATVGGAAGTQQSGSTSGAAPQVSSSQPSGTEHSHTGRDIAAGGAAAAAAGAGARSLQHHERSEDLRSSAAEDASRQRPTGAGEETLAGGHSYTITGGHQTAPVDAISSRDPNDRSSTSRGADSGSSTSPDAPISAVAAAPGRYEGQDFNQQGSTSHATPSATTATGERSLGRDDDSHTGRNAALGAGAAAAGVGGLAYASRDQGRHSTIHDATTVAPSGTGTSTSAPLQGTSTGYGTTDQTARGTSAAHLAPEGASAGYGTTSGTSASQLAPDRSPVGYSTAGTTTEGATTADPTQQRQDDHTGRNVALGAAAGTAAGGAAYAAHERSDERDLEKQREADAKEAARREKEHEKELERERTRAEKDEKKHQREIEKEEKKHEKEEKKHQKEVEKEEKKHEKEEREAAAAAERRESARMAAEEEDRKRREREAAAGIGAAGAVGAGTAAAEEKHEEKKEKKPSIFKRIFKRRKNKDTGEDEDYSTDDEEDKARHAATGGTVPVHRSEDKNRNVLGSSRDKEAYKEHPAWKGPATDTAAENSPSHPGAEERLGREGGAAAVAGTSAGASSALGESDRPHENTRGVGYDLSKDPVAARDPSSRDAGPTGTSATAGTTTGTGPTSGTDDRPRESLTGLPYDPSKDPATAARLSGQGDEGGLPGTHGVLGSEPLGEIGDHRR